MNEDKPVYMSDDIPLPDFDPKDFPNDGMVTFESDYFFESGLDQGKADSRKTKSKFSRGNERKGKGTIKASKQILPIHDVPDEIHLKAGMLAKAFDESS